MTSYYEYDLDGEHFIKDLSGKPFYEAITMVAIEITMSDCTDVDVTKIVIDGKEYRYVGWQPNMLREFYNAADPEDRVQIFLPQYDH